MLLRAIDSERRVFYQSHKINNLICDISVFPGKLISRSTDRLFRECHSIRSALFADSVKGVFGRPINLCRRFSVVSAHVLADFLGSALLRFLHAEGE